MKPIIAIITYVIKNYKQCLNQEIWKEKEGKISGKKEHDKNKRTLKRLM